MRLERFLIPAAVLTLAAGAFAQGPLDRATLGKAPIDSWTTYHGDYSGRHFSTLKQIDQSNVKALSLAWVYRANTAKVGAVIGGEGPEDAPTEANTTIKAIPLMVNGVLYFSTPDHAWAVDARTGHEIWHYFWKTTGGIHIGSRGMGMYQNWLFFETPDCYLVSLDASTGKERWHKQIADVKQEYFCTPSPLVLKDLVIVGMGGDSLDVPGWLEARDPETGDVKWKWQSRPMKKGDPGSETWPDDYSAQHGGGMTWQPWTYDPELNLIYVATGNPNPVMAAQSRQGDNLWTASIVALNADTGKLVWYFQVSPHDTHDWDGTQVPVLIDDVVNGQRRKLLANASRNGIFFLLDRTNGKNIVSKPFIDTLNWMKGFDSIGRPIPNPEKDPSVAGVLVSPAQGGATNWPAPAFSPDTGLMYVGTQRGYAMFYLTDTDKRPQGYGGINHPMGSLGNALLAIDYKTGKVAWSHPTQVGAQGLLATAGGLLFGGDGAGNFIAFDPKNGSPLWHAGVGNTSNAPITYMMDGYQYVLVGVGDSLYSFFLQ